MSFEDYTADAPCFVNEAGVKWWVHKSLTDYAKSKLGVDTKVRAYVTEHPDGVRSIVLIDGMEIVDASQSMEAIACEIDVLRLLKRDEKASKKKRRTVSKT